MRYSDGVFLDFDDILLRPKRSDLVSRKDVKLARDFKTRWHEDRILQGIPIVVSNMYSTGTPEMAASLKQFDCYTALDKSLSLEEALSVSNENAWFSIGESSSDLKKLENYLKTDALPKRPLINLEVANAHRSKFVKVIKQVRQLHPDIILMCGNVASSSMVEELILAGADIVKAGIGPGSACLTRKVTGVGVPQFSLIIECADAAHGLGGLICADGGCRTSGDISKAFAAGADFVMSGGLFAGHEECRGERIYDPQGKVLQVEFFGAASQRALEMRGIDNNYRPYEGAASWVDFKGPVRDTLRQLLGGIKSTCTYIGASGIKQIHRRAEIIRLR